MNNQIGHRLASGRCIENAPHAVTRGDEGAIQSSNSADQRQSILGDGSIAKLPRNDLCSAKRGCQSIAHNLQAFHRAVIGDNPARFSRQRALAGDGTDVRGAITTWKHLGRQCVASGFLVFVDRRPIQTHIGA